MNQKRKTRERGTAKEVTGTYANLDNIQVITSELGNHGFFLHSLFYSEEPSGGPIYQVKKEKNAVGA